MTRDHHFVDADNIVILPREPRPAEREYQRWSPFTVMELRDELVIDNGGHPLHSPYVERFWLPIVGPASICMARNLSARPSGSVVQINELGAELGVKGPIALRTIGRLVRFQIAVATDRTLLVRTHLAPLTVRQFGQLPPHLRTAHANFVEDNDE